MLRSSGNTGAATNTRKKDARLLYIMVLASSRLAALVELRTFMASKRDELFCAIRLGAIARHKQEKEEVGMITFTDVRPVFLQLLSIVFFSAVGQVHAQTMKAFINNSQQRPPVDTTMKITAQTFGTPLGSFNGVVAYSNGKTDSVNTSLPRTYGIPYQCVEYVNRYYVQHYNFANMKGNGNGSDLFTNLPTAFNLKAYANGGVVSPQVGDILCFAGGSSGNGHAAIVRNVTLTQVTVIQQNVTNDYADTAFAFAMSVAGGHYTVDASRLGSSYFCQGWLRSSTANNALVAYYPFEGNANDSSGNGNNGTIHGSPTVVTGVVGKAFQFGGIDNPSHIVVPNSPTLAFTDSFSISFWFNILSYKCMDNYGGVSYDGFNGAQWLFGKSCDVNGIDIDVYRSASDSLLHVQMENGKTNGTDEVIHGLGFNLGQWAFIAATIGNGRVKFYQDGALIADTTEAWFNLNPSTATNDIYIGENSCNFYPLNGTLDEIRIYRGVLSSNEIAALYDSSAPPANQQVTVMDELNGSTLGHAVGVTYTPALSGEGAVFTRATESRIEYAFDTQIPRQGTLEWWLKVNAGYYYSNYVLHDSTDDAPVFATDCYGGDVTWPGEARLRVFRDGSVLFQRATTYGVSSDYLLWAHNVGFTFNQWHAVGISYGSQGEYVMLDGKIVASDSTYTTPLSSAGNFSAQIDTPTIGQLISGFWGPDQYDGGFYGIVDRFRASTKQLDWALSDTALTAVKDHGNSLPTTYELYQNYPNPFNPTTVISYQLPTNAFVALKIYDVLGREVRQLVNERENAGIHSVTFDATNLPSGVYFYELQAGPYHDTKKLLLLK